MNTLQQTRKIWWNFKRISNQKNAHFGIRLTSILTIKFCKKFENRMEMYKNSKKYEARIWDAWNIYCINIHYYNFEQVLDNYWLGPGNFELVLKSGFRVRAWLRVRKHWSSTFTLVVLGRSLVIVVIVIIIIVIVIIIRIDPGWDLGNWIRIHPCWNFSCFKLTLVFSPKVCTIPYILLLYL